MSNDPVIVDPLFSESRDAPCRLCCEIDDYSTSLFASIYPGVVRQNCFLESQRLQVMLPIGPLFEGHLLLSSRGHAQSFGHLMSGILAELEVRLHEVRELLTRHYGRVVVFEHGAFSDALPGSCCLTHAHLNIVPIPKRLDVKSVISRVPQLVPMELGGVRAFVEGKQPYLFFMSDDGRSYGAKAHGAPSQLFRKLLADAAGRREWDWRAGPKRDAVLATLGKLIDAESK